MALTWRLGVAALMALLCSSHAHAQITEEPIAPLPDPKKFAHGLFVDAGLGAFVLLGEADAVGSGPAISARVGYDVFRVLAVQAHVAGSTHRTDFGAAPQSGQLLQIYQTMAELKLTVPLHQVSIYAHGGAGFAFLSTNILGTTELTEAETTRSVVYAGGLGVDYHLLSRHFSFGVEAAFAKLQAIKTTGGILSTAYIRYAF